MLETAKAISMILGALGIFLGVVFKFVLPIIMKRPIITPTFEKRAVFVCDAQEQTLRIERDIRPFADQITGGMRDLGAGLARTTEVQREISGALKRMEEADREWRTESRDTSTRLADQVESSGSGVRGSLHRTNSLITAVLQTKQEKA